MTVLDHFDIDFEIIRKKYPSEEAQRALNEVAELAEFWLMTKRNLVRHAIDNIIDFDLRDRAGLKEAFEKINVAIQEEIRERWTDIVLVGE